MTYEEIHNLIARHWRANRDRLVASLTQQGFDTGEIVRFAHEDHVEQDRYLRHELPKLLARVREEWSRPTAEDGTRTEGQQT